jgi:hypothetical protein
MGIAVEDDYVWIFPSNDTPSLAAFTRGIGDNRHDNRTPFPSDQFDDFFKERDQVFSSFALCGCIMDLYGLNLLTYQSEWMVYKIMGTYLAIDGNHKRDEMVVVNTSPPICLDCRFTTFGSSLCFGLIQCKGSWDDTVGEHFPRRGSCSG